jgi:hypothetical protein
MVLRVMFAASRVKKWGMRKVYSEKVKSEKSKSNHTGPLRQPATASAEGNLIRAGGVKG